MTSQEPIEFEVEQKADAVEYKAKEDAQRLAVQKAEKETRGIVITLICLFVITSICLFVITSICLFVITSICLLVGSYYVINNWLASLSPTSSPTLEIISKGILGQPAEPQHSASHLQKRQVVFCFFLVTNQ
jgi:uncharacterized membrane protein